MIDRSLRILGVAAILAGLGAAGAANAQGQMGAWHYEAKDGGYRATASGTINKSAMFGFACDSPGPVSIYAFIVPAAPLGVPRNGALKKGLTYQVDNGASITKDWFYPDETKNETEITKTIGVDSFDVLNAVKKGKRTVRVVIAKTDGKTLDLAFDIAGGDAALAKLVADCKSVEYK
jgi:hypothetical protein